MHTNPRPVWAAAAAVALAAPLLVGSQYGLTLLNMALINGITVIGLHILYGLTGILSFAQVAFLAIGAYTSAILVKAGLPFVVGLVAAGLVAALAGILVGVPTLRLKTHYLTMATLAIGIVLEVLLRNWETLTGGPTGLRLIPPASFGPLVLEDFRLHYYLVLLVLAGVILGVVRLRNSHLGRAMAAIRGNELAAQVTGVPVTRLKVLAFALSALCAGLAGSLYVHLVRYVSPDTFDLRAMLQIMAMLLIGGRRSVPGAVLGAVLLTFLPEWLRFLKDWYPTFYGVGLLLILSFLPDGLAQALEKFRQRFARRLPVTGGRA